MLAKPLDQNKYTTWCRAGFTGPPVYLFDSERTLVCPNNKKNDLCLTKDKTVRFYHADASELISTIRGMIAR